MGQSISPYFGPDLKKLAQKCTQAILAHTKVRSGRAGPSGFGRPIVDISFIFVKKTICFLKKIIN